MVSPLYPYAGGKRRMLEFIEENTPDFGVYHEPFLGGGAVALHLLKTRMDATFHLSDLNEEIIHAWEQTRSAPHELVEAIEDHADRHSREYFIAVRNWDRRPNWTTHFSPLERAARFIYISSTSFGGMWNTNQANQCVSTFGKEAFRPKVANLLAVSRLLNKRNVSLRAASFVDTGSNFAAGDFAYLDPPYATDQETFEAWDGYQSGGDLGAAFQRKVKTFINQQTAKGVLVLASNASTRTTEELYAGWNKMTKQIVWTSGQGVRQATEVLWGNIHLARSLRAQMRTAAG